MTRKRRAIGGLSVLLAASVGLGAGGSGCGSSHAAVEAATCTLNSDCDAPLVCVFSRCHAQCKTSIDCANGERCVPSNQGPNVCQLADESTCSSGGICNGDQVCSTADQECRTPCVDTGSCASGQYCVTSASSQSVCYQANNALDQSELEQAGVLALDGAVLVDGSPAATYVAAGDGASPGGGDSGNDATAGGDATVEGGPDGGDGAANASDARASMDSGPLVNPCPFAEAQFGNVARSDANPDFLTGVGVRTADKLLAFLGYVGPDPSGDDAGDGGDVNLVYVQAFDPVTAAALGPATSLFAAPPGPGFGIYSAAVAPTGEIAIAYGYNQGGLGGYVYQGRLGSYGYDDRATGVYAAFVTGGADAGPFGMQLERSAELEANQIEGQPHVTWSVPAAAFMFSWEYTANAAWFVAVRNFFPDGAPASGGVDVVPTDATSSGVYNNAFAQDLGAAAASAATGSLGVAYISTVSDSWQELTVLDSDGNLLGAPVAIDTSSGHWVALGATATGFVYVYDTTSGLDAKFLPASADAGVAPSVADGGASTIPAVMFPGSVPPLDGRAANDDTGGAGGVGVGLLYSDGVSFLYVDADGVTHRGPTGVIAQAYTDGDEMNVSNFNGSFAVSLSSRQNGSVQVAATGCPSP